LGVIRTLLHRCDTVETEAEDKTAEKEHIRKALEHCGYPPWAWRKVEEQRNRKEETSERERKLKQNREEKPKGLVVLPYISGMSEALTRVFKKRGITTALKPHQTIRNILVHPKDKTDKDKTCGVVYKIPCANCNKVYIGETGRKLATRVKEHKDEVNKTTQGVTTRTKRKESTETMHKSAMTDHAAKHNHVIDWDNTDIKDKEGDRTRRIVKEAIRIREEKNNMNRDEGCYTLSHTYDPLIPHKHGAGGGARLS